jgi:hypothetical protein
MSASPPKPLESWPRPYLQAGGGDAFLFYWVVGDFQRLGSLSRSTYRSNGLPKGVTLQQMRRGSDSGQFDELLASHFGRFLDEQLPAGLAAEVRAAPEYLVVSGTVSAPETLDYLRDTVGLLSWLLDAGGAALLDWQCLKWWTVADWRQQVFEPAAPVPSQHVQILLSEDEERPGARWYHTRGMRKFGRPDISVRGVPPELHEPVTELCHRFIQLQALGGVVPEGQPIRLQGLPEGMVSHTRGDEDDPDFNNAHLDIVWPGA